MGGLPEFLMQLGIFRSRCQGLFTSQVPCTPSIYCPIANSESNLSQQPVQCSTYNLAAELRHHWNSLPAKYRMNWTLLDFSAGKRTGISKLLNPGASRNKCASSAVASLQSLTTYVRTYVPSWMEMFRFRPLRSDSPIIFRTLITTQTAPLLVLGTYCQYDTGQALLHAFWA